MKKSHRFLFGIIPAVFYVLLAIVVAWQEFGCSGLDVNVGCGLGTILITFPSFITVGRLFSKLGLEINFSHAPNASDVFQLTVHILICALIVYLIGYGLGRAVSYCVKFLRH